MAGYDFSVKVGSDVEDALLRPMLHGMQLRCRQRWVQLRYRRTKTGYLVTVDGPLVNIQASRQPIAIALGAMADASQVRLPRARRLQLGRRLLRGYMRGAWDASMRVLELSRHLGGTPSSYVFDGVEDPVIQYRLDGLTTMLESWQNEDASSEQVVEELHAVTELSMGFLLGTGWDDRSYADQVGEMVRRGRMTAEDSTALLGWKERRRAVRHHLATLTREDLAERLPGALRAVHALVAQLPG